MMTGIVAVAENMAIGKDGRLPWHCPADLKFFKQTTMESAIVMGSNTFRSIGRPLPGRLNVVLSRRGSDELPAGVITIREAAAAVDLAAYLKKDLYIIGGAATYASFAANIDRWLVTRLPLTVADADVFFDESLLNGFEPRTRIDLGDGVHVDDLRRR